MPSSKPITYLIYQCLYSSQSQNRCTARFLCDRYTIAVHVFFLGIERSSAIICKVDLGLLVHFQKHLKFVILGYLKTTNTARDAAATRD